MSAAGEALRAALERRLERLWYAGPAGLGDRVLGLVLAPAAALVRRVSVRRRQVIRGLPPPTVPVVVIGNLVAGGAGKTPATIAIASALAARGWRVGLLAAGYRAPRQHARIVSAGSDATLDGDEAVLLARATGLPVAAGRARADALKVLLATRPEVDVVLSDDGLQHAGLPRTVQIAVFDARGAGNGRLLPAGPLREPLAHAREFDALLLNGTDRCPVETPAPTFRFDVAPLGARRLADGRRESCDGLARLARGLRVVAIAGISQPGRFFATLRGLGIEARPMPLADHARIDAALVAAIAADLVVMTDKDAVKCGSIDDGRCWALEVGARIGADFVEWLEERLRGHPIARDPGLPVVQGTP